MILCLKLLLSSDIIETMSSSANNKINNNKINNSKIYLRNNKRWSDNEDRRLIDLYRKYMSFKPVAIDLLRSVDAVQARFVKIAVCPKHDKQFLNDKKDYIADRYNINRNDFARYLKYAGIKDTITKSRDNKYKQNNKYDTSLFDEDTNNLIESSDDEYEPSKEIKAAAKKIDKKIAVYEDSSENDESNLSYDSENSDKTYNSDSEDSNDESGSDYDYESDYEKEVYSHLISKNRQDRNNIKSILKYVKTLHHKITDLEKKFK